jgi:hypothetical protein
VSGLRTRGGGTPWRAGDQKEGQFVLHGDGPASEWTAQAKTGDHLAIAGPGRARLDNPQPRLLDGILCLLVRAEHPIGDGAQARPVRLKLLAQPIFIHHHI